MKNAIVCFATVVLGALTLAAEIPPAEKILPADTLAVFTVPDYAGLKETNRRSPQGRLWQDPAMKPFVEKFTAKLNEEFTAPLEKDLGVTLSNYFPLLQGQVTFAVIQNGWDGGKEKPQPGWLVLLDTKGRSGQLKTNLAALKRKWTDADKTTRTEKIRDVEFTVLKLSTNDVPPTLQKLFPGEGPKFPDADPENPNTPKPKPVNVEMFIGQSDSLLIAGNQAAVIEQVLASLSGGGAPVLADNAAFEANRLALFRNAQAFGWVNAKAITTLINKQLAKDAAANADGPTLTPFKPEKVIGALGLDALKSVAFSLQFPEDGCAGELFLTVPETDRHGLLSLIAGEPKEVLPPTFVPAGAVKFQRLRLNAQKTWDNLEKTLGAVSPTILAAVNFAIDMAGGLAKEKNPDYNLKQSLLGSLGDDIITYEKAPRSAKVEDLASAPSITLVGAVKPDQFVEALKFMMTGTSQSGKAPKEREFRGRKIYSMELSSRSIAGKPAPARALSFAAANGYVAFSTDPALLEEFLRGSEDTGKPLRETAGLTAAAARVTTSRTSWLAYENQAETMRATINTLKQAFAKTKSGDTNSDTFGIPSRQVLFTDWFDVSLLPEFDRIAKYFYLSLSAGTATPEGLSFKMFTPTPPQLKAAASKN